MIVNIACLLEIKMSKNARPRFFTLTTVALALAAQLVVASTGAPHLSTDLLGSWAGENGDGKLIRLEPERFLEIGKDGLKVWGVEGYDSGKTIVRSGLTATWRIALENGFLSLERNGRTERYRKLDRTPEELELRPMELGRAVVVEAGRLKEVQGELAQRRRKDQEVRTDPARTSEMVEVDAGNVRYLRGLIAELGWIDVARFGEATSAGAFLIVQHSGDLGLMMAVLPLIEKDARRYPDFAQPYTLLFDRLQIDLGRKQRYGTQLDQDPQGNPFVLPLEDPARVDEFLKELRLPPLSEYLAMASKYLYGGKTIRLPRGDE